MRHGGPQGSYNRRMHADEFDRLQVGERVLYHEGFTPYRLWPGTVVVRQQLLRQQPLLGIGVPGLGRIVYPSRRATCTGTRWTSVSRAPSARPPRRGRDPIPQSAVARIHPHRVRRHA